MALPPSMDRCRPSVKRAMMGLLSHDLTEDELAACGSFLQRGAPVTFDDDGAHRGSLHVATHSSTHDTGLQDPRSPTRAELLNMYGPAASEHGDNVTHSTSTATVRSDNNKAEEVVNQPQNPFRMDNNPHAHPGHPGGISGADDATGPATSYENLEGWREATKTDDKPPKSDLPVHTMTSGARKSLSDLVQNLAGTRNVSFEKPTFSDRPSAVARKNASGSERAFDKGKGKFIASRPNMEDDPNDIEDKPVDLLGSLPVELFDNIQTNYLTPADITSIQSLTKGYEGAATKQTVVVCFTGPHCTEFFEHTPSDPYSTPIDIENPPFPILSVIMDGSLLTNGYRHAPTPAQISEILFSLCSIKTFTHLLIRQCHELSPKALKAVVYCNPQLDDVDIGPCREFRPNDINDIHLYSQMCLLNGEHTARPNDLNVNFIQNLDIFQGTYFQGSGYTTSGSDFDAVKSNITQAMTALYALRLALRDCIEAGDHIGAAKVQNRLDEWSDPNKPFFGGLSQFLRAYRFPATFIDALRNFVMNAPLTQKPSNTFNVPDDPDEDEEPTFYDTQSRFWYNYHEEGDMDTFKNLGYELEKHNRRGFNQNSDPFKCDRCEFVIPGFLWAKRQRAWEDTLPPGCNESSLRGVCEACRFDDAMFFKFHDSERKPIEDALQPFYDYCNYTHEGIEIREVDEQLTLLLPPTVAATPATATNQPAGVSATTNALAPASAAPAAPATGNGNPQPTLTPATTAPTMQPPATNNSVSLPPATDSSASQLPATDNSASLPPATDSSASLPPATVPPTPGVQVQMANPRLAAILGNMPALPRGDHYNQRIVTSGATDNGASAATSSSGFAAPADVSLTSSANVATPVPSESAIPTAATPTGSAKGKRKKYKETFSYDHTPTIPTPAVSKSGGASELTKDETSPEDLTDWWTKELKKVEDGAEKGAEK